MFDPMVHFVLYMCPRHVGGRDVGVALSVHRSDSSHGG